MNYKKLYFNIIRNRRNNPLPTEEYGEVHHIKPRSFYHSDFANFTDSANKDEQIWQSPNPDNENNLIRLSAREHFIVHFLLYKIYKHRSKNIFQKSKREIERYKKMTLAFNMMINAKSKSQKRLNKNVNNRVFEQLRKTVSEHQTKYSFRLVKNMFDFYVKNNLNPQKMDVLNQYFDVDLNYDRLTNLFYRYGFKISQHTSYIAPKNNIRYSLDEIKNMFDFYVENNLTPEKMNIFNQYFNVDFNYDRLTSLLSRYGFKKAQHESYIVPKNNIRYSLNEIKNMFEFYIQNNLSPKQIDIFNKNFNVNFNYNRLKNLFNRYGFKIFQSKNKLNHDKC